MIVLDGTIVNVALPTIRDDLGFSETSLAWIVNAYLLTFGGFLLLGGRLGDLFGQRRMFLIGIAALHGRVARLRPRELAGAAHRGAGGAGARRRARRGGGALARDDALHRAGRPREGDGHLRLRPLGRRCRRRAARRRPHRHPLLELDLLHQHPRRGRRLRSLPAAAAGGARPCRRKAPRPRRSADDHRLAHARRLRDRERERDRVADRGDTRPAGRRRRAPGERSS